MKTKQLLVYLIIMLLASCKPEEQPPVVSYVFTDVSVDVGQINATITCRNTSVDDEKVHASVLLSKNENITDATKYPLRLQNDTLRGTINGLEKNTMYYFCFEVYTANEHKRTDEVHHFQTTGGDKVTVTTSEAINVTQTTATGGGSVSVEGNGVVSMRGVCWDTITNPNALQSPHLVSGEGAGTFLVNLTGLIPGTTYHMKAYAVCDDVVYYGNEVVFKTSSAQVATVTTGEVTNITRTSALGSGEVTDDGGAEVIQRGVCWSTNHNPTISGNHANSSTAGTGAFTANMTGLTPKTKYYVRAFAKNDMGVTYGEEVEFVTADDESSPTVTTNAVTNITQTSAEGHGNVTADGGTNVTERGICWSTSHNPTTNGSHAAASSAGTGTFTVNMTGLSPGTIYYVRAYAKNSVGTAYGEEVSFSTTANKPTVTTEVVSNITQTTAQGGGNVTDDGGTEVTERGICWSTSHNPTIANSHASNGTGMGGYTVNMTGLTSNTTYYVRAYATNSQGTSYGNEVSFKTSQNYSAPTVTTSQVTNITQTSATGGGNVTSDGGATVTERGICWSTNHNPTTSGSHANSGTGTGSFTVNMTGLTANTTYYVRAYAKNSEGTSYGSEVSFQTSATTPTVTTNQITNITSTTATGGGNVTNGGGANVTARGVCWGTSHNPTVSSNHTTDGTGTGNYTSSITGLSANTTYYVRAYATNSAGTAYGSEVSFTTSQVSSYTIAVSANPANGGTVTGGGTYQQGQSCTVHATANSGYTFTNWTENGNVVSTNANYTFTVNANRTLVANFSTQSYTISVSASPSNGGSVSGGGNYNYGQSCTVHATANSGYTFTNWTENGNVVSTNANYTFTVNANRTLVANFSTQSYTISISASPSNGGSVSGGGNYNYGQSCTVHATANSGYTFTNWTENGNVVSTNANYTFTVNANRTLVANFTYNGGGGVPTGAINGLFTVNANGDQVYFSQGNLQYQASTNTWRFATNQYDYIGSSNSNMSQTYTGWIDLFGWGTSGYNHGAVCYQPWSTSTTYSDYYAYGNSTFNLYDQTGQADWGYNSITNGGNTNNIWRTLTYPEWQYIFNTRSTTSGIRYAKAQVNNIKGVIILPDNWNASTYSLNNTNSYEASFSSNIITETQWNAFVSVGAVFLPAAGCRISGPAVSGVGSFGQYWSSSKCNIDDAFTVDFDNYFLGVGVNDERYKGVSVRLVHDAQ